MSTREIKTTLAVDGEQQFKRSIGEAKTSIRNLGTQLSLAQAEFKKDGDAMKLMETRAKTLKAEMKQQEEIVRALEGAVKDATKKYGEGSTEAEKWEAELNRAKTTMANLQKEFSNNEQGLDKNGKAFATASEKAEEFSDAVSSMQRGISFSLITDGIGKISGAFDTAITKAAELATKMWNMMRDAASWADDEITLASVYGISVEELQQMQYAAKLTDTDVDLIIKSRQKLAQAMGNELNSKDMQAAFQSVRVQVYNQDTGEMRDLEQVFWDVGAALMSMDDEVLQNNNAMKIFGESWAALKPLFMVGRDRYGEIMGEAPIVKQEQIDRLGELQDSLDRLDTEFNTLKMNVLSELAPSFKILSDALTSLMSEFNAYLETDEGQQMMAELRGAVTDFFSEIRNIDFQDAVNNVSGALGGIRDAFDWVKNNKKGVTDALTAIGIAFGGIKVAEVALNIGKIVSGFQTLWNGANNKLPNINTVTGGGSGGESGGGGTVVTGDAGTSAAKQSFFKNPVFTTIGRTLGSIGIATGIVAATQILPAAIASGVAQEHPELYVGNEEYVQTAEYTDQEAAALDEWIEAQNVMRETEEAMLEGDTAAYDKWIAANETVEKLADIVNSDVFEKYWKFVNNAQYSTMDQLPAVEDVLGVKIKNATESSEGVRIEGMPIARPEEVTAAPDTGFDINEYAKNAALAYFANGGSVPGLFGEVSPVLYSGTAGASGAGSQVTKSDLEAFDSVPSKMQQAVAQAMKGLLVQMDRVTIGHMVAPVVSQIIASDFDQ